MRQRFGLGPESQMKHLDVSVTLQAAVHFGKDYTENLRSTKNQPKKSLRQEFQVTQKWIIDQTEITGITTIAWRQPMWRETTLLTDSLQLPKPTSSLTQCHVWGGMVLDQSKRGKARLNGFWKHVIKKIWIGSTGNKWNSSGKFTRIHFMRILDEIQKMRTESKFSPEQFERRIIFMLMYNDIDWGKRRNRENCIANAHRVTEYARRFTRGHWSFPGPGSEKKWYGTHVNKPDGEWDKTAEDMMLNFAEFRATQRIRKRRIEKQKNRSKIHPLQR